MEQHELSMKHEQGEIKTIEFDSTNNIWENTK